MVVLDLIYLLRGAASNESRKMSKKEDELRLLRKGKVVKVKSGIAFREKGKDSCFVKSTVRFVQGFRERSSGLRQI